MVHDMLMRGSIVCSIVIQMLFAHYACLSILLFAKLYSLMHGQLYKKFHILNIIIQLDISVRLHQVTTIICDYIKKILLKNT